MSYEYDGLIFWPKKKVRRTFKEVQAAMGTDGEAAALRVFFARMKHHLKTSEEVDENPEETMRLIEHYERPRLEAEIARMTGTDPVPCEGCTFAGCKAGV